MGKDEQAEVYDGKITKTANDEDDPVNRSDEKPNRKWEDILTKAATQLLDELPVKLWRTTMKGPEIGPIAPYLTIRGFEIGVPHDDGEPDLLIMMADSTILEALLRKIPNRRYWALLVSRKGKAFRRLRTLFFPRILTAGNDLAWMMSDITANQQIGPTFPNGSFVKGQRLKIVNWNINGLRSVVRKGFMKEMMDDMDPDIICLTETKTDEKTMVTKRHSALNDQMTNKKDNNDGIAIITKTKKKKRKKRMKNSNTTKPKAINQISINDTTEDKEEVQLRGEKGELFLDDLDRKGYRYRIWATTQGNKGHAGVAILSKIEPISQSSGLGCPEIDKEGRFVQMEFIDFHLVCQYTPCSGENFENKDKRMRFDELVSKKMHDGGFQHGPRSTGRIRLDIRRGGKSEPPDNVALGKRKLKKNNE